MPHAANNSLEFSIVDVPDAALNTAWTWGTVVYRDDAGGVVGYGRFARLSEGTAEVMANFSASGVALLSQAPLSEDA